MVNKVVFLKIQRSENIGLGDTSVSKFFELLQSLVDVPGLIAFWRTRPGAFNAGAPATGTPPKTEAGIKAKPFNLGRNDEALAIQALLRVLTEKGLVEPKERDALWDIIINHLTNAECSVFQKTLGIDEQERSFSETTTEQNAKGKDVKKEKTRKETRNYRGEEIVVGLCKLAAIDKERTIALMKKMGVTKTSGDTAREILTDIGSILEKYEVLNASEIAMSVKDTSKKLEFLLKKVLLPVFLWAVLLTAFSTVQHGSYWATGIVIAYMAFTWWRSSKENRKKGNNPPPTFTSRSGD